MENDETTTAPTTENKNVYLGNLKTRVKKKDGSKFLSGTICIEDILEVDERYIQNGKTNGKRYVRVVVEKKLTVDKYNNTHSVKVDTFIPNPNFNPNNNTANDDVI